MKTCEIAVKAGEECIENPELCAICVAQPEACVAVYAEGVVVHVVTSTIIEKGKELIPFHYQVLQEEEY
uniref:Uncharacterized protein n=1 Tax=Panagrolaimus sp. ES5 TaxID=591445 RepID=A0AC34FUM0_9BILA